VAQIQLGLGRDDKRKMFDELQPALRRVAAPEIAAEMTRSAGRYYSLMEAVKQALEAAWPEKRRI